MRLRRPRIGSLFGRIAKRPGLTPGTLVHVGEHHAERTSVTVTLFDAENITEVHGTDADLERARTHAGLAWINVDGVHEPGVIERIGELFGLHTLVLEDVMHTTQRPKVEDYEDYVYIVARMLSTAEAGDGGFSVESEQVSLVLGRSWVITFQERPGDVFGPVRDRLQQNKGRIRKSAIDYLAYSLLDTIVDNYFHVLERFSALLEELDTAATTDPNQQTLAEIREAKRTLIQIRRAVWPLRDAVSGLMRAESKLIRKQTMPFLRDLHDHAVQVVDIVETLREFATGITDVYLSSLSHRTNEVMKVLTVIATIFIPLTFIAGVYGMNFDNMPELHWEHGYWYVWGIMVSAGIGFYIYFRRRQWL